MFIAWRRFLFMKKIFTLIVIINIIGIIIGCGTGTSKTTIANNSIEKDRLEIINEKDPLLRRLKDYTHELQGVMGIAVKKK